MRSLAEIQFRLRQELGNLAMLALPPQGSGRRPAKLPLPDGAAVAPHLRGTDYARNAIAIADSVVAHRFPILGITIETGLQIDWRRDYLHGVSTGGEYFRRVPYLDFSRAGDHKVVWELNRHQHLVLLAQAFHLSGRRGYLDEAFRQLESWLEANPFLHGINWASALEVAFRALSWMWLWHLAGGEMPDALARRFLRELHRHGQFLELNLSIYFSPNTHLLGEAVALHALGVMLEHPRWRTTGARIVEEAMLRQVREDGSHFEQSAYYHVYALDFFLLYRLLGSPAKAYDERLAKMAEYLDALLGNSGVLPLFGDDDGGRLFHPYGDRTRFGIGTMATCALVLGRPEWLRSAEDLPVQAAWWAGSGRIDPAPPMRKSKWFADAGVAVMVSGDAQVVIKAGPFGEGSGGHSHSDILSLMVRVGDREILIDPGTYTYIADPKERNAFRGSAAHNTIRIDGRDQAVPAGPFRWVEKPAVTVHEWAAAAEGDLLDATCAYAGFRHRRRVVLEKAGRLRVTDTVEGPTGEHTLEQFWHLGSAEDALRMSFGGKAETVEMWRSRALCAKERATGVRVTVKGPLPAKLETVLVLATKAHE